jgi:hypothetical protein
MLFYLFVYLLLFYRFKKINIRIISSKLRCYLIVIINIKKLYF